MIGGEGLLGSPSFLSPEPDAWYPMQALGQSWNLCLPLWVFPNSGFPEAVTPGWQQLVTVGSIEVCL